MLQIDSFELFVILISMHDVQIYLCGKKKMGIELCYAKHHLKAFDSNIFQLGICLVLRQVFTATFSCSCRSLVVLLAS